MSWVFYALLSATAAAATAILAKLGIRDVPSNLATAIRTIVILLFAWALVFARHEHTALRTLDRRTVVFLVLSGLATGISWMAYFHALKLAPASRVQPIDKLSLALTLLLSFVVLHETMTWKLVAGVGLMVAGALLTL